MALLDVPRKQEIQTAGGRMAGQNGPSAKANPRAPSFLPGLPKELEHHDTPPGQKRKTTRRLGSLGALDQV